MRCRQGLAKVKAGHTKGERYAAINHGKGHLHVDKPWFEQFQVLCDQIPCIRHSIMLFL